MKSQVKSERRVYNLRESRRSGNKIYKENSKYLDMHARMERHNRGYLVFDRSAEDPFPE